MAKWQGTSERILILSGEDDHRKILANEVRRSGWKASPCASLEEAKLLLAEEHYAAALCDDDLAGDNFVSAIAPIKRLANSTPVIVVSRRDDWDSYMIALAAGAADYLAFPPYPGEVEQSLGKTAKVFGSLAHAA